VLIFTGAMIVGIIGAKLAKGRIPDGATV